MEWRRDGEEFESSTQSGKTTVIERPSEVVVDEVLVAFEIGYDKL